MKLSILIVGPQATGKTTLADSIVADYQEGTGIVVEYNKRSDGYVTLATLLYRELAKISQGSGSINFVRIQMLSLTQADYELIKELAKNKMLKFNDKHYGKKETSFSLLIVEHQCNALKFNPADFHFFDQIIILNRLPQYADNQEEKTALPAQ